jgi:hypothetical protein
MTDNKEFTSVELEGQHAAILPEREALGLINIANVSAVNLAVAVNAASFGSSANAFAGQAIGVGQF